MTESNNNPALVGPDSSTLGGQAALKRRMAIDPDIRNRSITGAVLWSLQAAIGAVQQFGPAGDSMPRGVFHAYLGFTATMALLCLFVGPRLGGRAFRIAEEFVVALGWLATTALVAATGGANSADLGLFANVMFYCAYFMSPRRAGRHVAVGTLLMWAPFVYDFNTIEETNFAQRALVMTVVLWAMVILIARNRQRALEAEMEARRLALTDPLTGVANLHTFSDELQETLIRASRSNSQVGVAFVDVNGLKAANTVYGHAGGDQLIRRTAQALRMVSSERDQVARVGGDEFSVIVKDADAGQMKQFESDFAVALQRLSATGEAPVCDLSASIGTAVYPEDGATLDDLMQIADERMYDSKAALPPRIPTPETSGGRSLSDRPTEGTSRIAAFIGNGAPAASLAWLLAAGMIAAGGVSSSVEDVHPRLAMAIAGLCVVVAAALAIVDEVRRPRAEKVSNTLAVLIAIPAIYATGGAATPILPLAYLVVAHAAYALSTREAIVRTSAMLAILFATLLSNVETANFTGVSVIFGEVVVIAALLRYNRLRADAAEREALRLSRIDALTGLANRRVFELNLATAAATEHDATPVYDAGGLILIDVDNFKTINTTGGHKAGDEVLRMIAAVLEGAAGSDAIVCRIGGDEFAIIAKHGDGSTLMRTAAKCRAAIGAVDWHVLCDPKVTMSFGYATWEYVDRWKDIVVAADLALRMSKDAGKDTVRVAPEDSSRASRAV